MTHGSLLFFFFFGSCMRGLGMTSSDSTLSVEIEDNA